MVRRRAGDPDILADHHRIVRRIQLVRPVAGGIRHTVLKSDRAGRRDFHNSVVELVSDERVPVLESDGAGWVRVRVAPRGQVRAVTEHGALLAIDFQYTVVPGIGDERVAAGQPTSKGNDIQPFAEGRDHSPQARNFEHAAIVLVGDQDVAVAQDLGAVRVLVLFLICLV